MANVNQPNPNAIANQPNPPSWRARTTINLAPPLHDFPKHPEKDLPNFDPEKVIFVEDQLQSFYLALEILAIEHEDVVCRLFPHTFEAKASTWYFGLQANSIVDWDNFVRVFKGKFGSQRTTTTLMK